MLRSSPLSMRALVSKKAYAALYFNAASISSLNLTWNQLSSWFSFKHTHSCLEKRLRSTCLLFRRSFYIFLQLNVGSIKLIRNAFGNKTYLRVFVSPTPFEAEACLQCCCNFLSSEKCIRIEKRLRRK